jgi:hypothetical protein
MGIKVVDENESLLMRVSRLKEIGLRAEPLSSVSDIGFV